jgi:hypothetical protein
MDAHCTRFRTLMQWPTKIPRTQRTNERRKTMNPQRIWVFEMVPGGGVEPPRSCLRRILSPPPHHQFPLKSGRFQGFRQLGLFGRRGSVKVDWGRLVTKLVTILRLANSRYNGNPRPTPEATIESVFEQILVSLIPPVRRSTWPIPSGCRRHSSIARQR